MYSCNQNQNYFIRDHNHHTSRVLQPPGGASSISLGGYGLSSLSSVRSKSYNNAPAPAPTSYSNPSSANNSYKPKQSYASYNDNSRDYDYPKQDDMYDEPPLEIPGLTRANSRKSLSSNEYADELRKQIEIQKQCDRDLEDRYTRKSSYSGNNDSRRMPLQDLSMQGANSRFGSNEQTDKSMKTLRMSQYADELKRQIEVKKQIDRELDSKAYRNYDHQENYNNQAPVSTRSRQPPGGKTQFSIGWN